jgi:hypothetical protein
MSKDYGTTDTLEAWVMNKCDGWRDHFESNYSGRFDEYYRIWRGIWDASDSMRMSERSRLISPATQQAVESSVAEIEEATFGRGNFFDIRDDLQDPDPRDIGFLKKQLTEDLSFAKTRSTVAECLINAAVFGTGIGELMLEETTELTPATQPAMDGQMTAIGVMKKDRFIVKLDPVMPQNFLIDPLATSIEDALGVAIDKMVPEHQVRMNIDSGIYMDVDFECTPSDPDLEDASKVNPVYEDGMVRLTKYYGLVPTELLKESITVELSQDGDETEEVIKLADEDDESSYTEVILVIANGSTLLKVEKNPYMKGDRPVVAFSWDIVPSRFWGRGICEKAYNSQKALDTELRARVDALALTVHPMMAIDASRMPRGAKLDIRPGKTLLTNGNPAEILQPFKFGSLDQVTFNQAQQLQSMVQQSTGAIDSAGIPASINGEGTAAGISMGLGAIIKRHKRTLINFQENFLIPFIEKAACRYMQFVPELYPVKDYKFVATSTLGIIAREYETTQLVQLLQTMPQESPVYNLLVTAVVDNMAISNRDEIIAAIQQAAQPNPQAQQLQQVQTQMQMESAMAQLENIKAQTAEVVSRVQQNNVETQLLPIEEETRRIAAMSKNMPMDEFKKLVEYAKLQLKEKEINVKENMVEMQMRQAGNN